MPYSIVRSGKGYAIVSKRTGKTVGRSRTRRDAVRSARARLAGAHGWKRGKS